MTRPLRTDRDELDVLELVTPFTLIIRRRYKMDFDLKYSQSFRHASDVYDKSFRRRTLIQRVGITYNII